MTNDPATASVTARILFDGMMLMCVNKKKNNRCEVGFIKCPKHEPQVKIETHTTGTPVPPRTFPVTEDLYVQVVKPQTEDGVTRHDAGDDRDFDLVLDLEGFKLHRDRLDVKTDLFAGKLAITAGELYAHQLKPDVFKLVRWTEADPIGEVLGRFDRIQELVGLNIVCRAGQDSGIVIIGANTGEKVELPNHPGTSYTITFSNNCLPDEILEAELVGSDFRLYYTVATPKDRPRYDFLRLGLSAPSPDVCELGFLGATPDLGFVFEPPPGQGTDAKEARETKAKARK